MQMIKTKELSFVQKLVDMSAARKRRLGPRGAAKKQEQQKQCRTKKKKEKEEMQKKKGSN